MNRVMKNWVMQSWSTAGDSSPHPEPTHPRPLPGGEETILRALSVPLPGGVRGGFMVSMHARKRKAALPEPQGRAGVSPACVGNADGTEPLALVRLLGRRDACPTLVSLRFMVSMHARKREQVRHDSDGAFVQASEQGRLVHLKRRHCGKTLRRGRPRPMVESAPPPLTSWKFAACIHPVCGVISTVNRHKTTL